MSTIVSLGGRRWSYLFLYEKDKQIEKAIQIAVKHVQERKERNSDTAGMNYKIVEVGISTKKREAQRALTYWWYVQSVVKYHGHAPCGTKEDFVLCVSLISNTRKHLCFNR